MTVLRVPFAGAPREGPLTMAQANMLKGMLELQEAGDRYTLNLWLSVGVPGGSTLERVGAALSGLLNRHEVLRSRFTRDGEPRQVVHAAGSLDVDVHEAGAHTAATVERLRGELFDRHFDITGEPPLRAAVVTRDGAPVRLVLALSHLACDQGSLEVLRRDLAALLRTGDAPPPTHPTRQPIDQAAHERDPTSQARSAAAIAFWRDTVAAAPQAMFAVPLAAPDPQGPQAQARLSSPAIALAAAAVAARTRTSPATAVLAAVAALLGLRTGQEQCLIAAPTANRFLPELLEFLGPLAQDALLALPLTDATFDDLVRRARTVSLMGYRHSQYDAGALWAALDAVGLARGTKYARDAVFNNVSPPTTGPLRPCPPEQLAKAVPETELYWVPAPPMPARFVCLVHRLDGAAELSLWASTRHLPRPEIAAFLSGIERLLVAAASSTVPLAQLSTVAGVTAPVRDGEWRCVDGCWVRPSACTTVLDGLPPVAKAAVFAEPDATLGSRLVGYVVPRPGPVDLVELHASCVAALPGNESAMAPHRYVVCESAPVQLDDEAAWRDRPVLASGTGRPN